MGFVVYCCLSHGAVMLRLHVGLLQMLHVGRNALTDPGKVVRSAQFVQDEVSRHHHTRATSGKGRDKGVYASMQILSTCCIGYLLCNDSRFPGCSHSLILSMGISLHADTLMEGLPRFHYDIPGLELAIDILLPCCCFLLL